MFSLVLSLMACNANETFLHFFDDNPLPDPMAEDGWSMGDDQYGGTGWVIPDEEEPAPDLTPDGAAVAWAHAHGTTGADQPDAMEALAEGRLAISTRDGMGLPAAIDLGASLHVLGADGQELWSQVLAPADSGVVIHTLLGTPDGGLWACADVPVGAAIAPWAGPLPESWGQSLLAVRFDRDGELLTVRGLGATNGADLAGGCGLDDDGDLSMDAQVQGGPVELRFEHGLMLVPSLVDRGFSLVLDDQGALVHLATWPAAGLSRRASVVQSDGSLFQVVDYTGVPAVRWGVEQLPECPADQVCRAMLAVDGDGSMSWLAGMGGTDGGAVVLRATDDGGLLLITRPGRGAVLPQAGVCSDAVAGDATVVARYTADLSLSWVQRVDSELFVQAVADDGADGALLGIWTGAAQGVVLGDREIEVEHDQGAMVLAALDPDGQPDWLFASGGTGTAWPTGLLMVEDELVVMGGLRGAIVLDQGGETEVGLLSAADDSGAYTSDVLLTRLGMRWDE
jgi:hypothetical protein